MSERQTSRRGLILLYGHPDVLSFSSSYGTFEKDEDGTIEVPEAAAEEAETHGFYKSPEALRAAMAPKPSAKPKQVGMDGVIRERVVEHHHYYGEQPNAAAPAKAAKTSEEIVAKQDRFALLEYCEANSVEVPEKTDNAALRELVLAHMKAESDPEAESDQSGQGGGEEGKAVEGKPRRGRRRGKSD